MKNLISVIIFIFSSQIGSGVFILPALLSSVGLKGIYLLLFIGIMAGIITNIFANTGDNSHEIISNAFGKKIGNFFFFLYWFISWFSTIVLFKELIGYIGVAYPYSFFIELLVWLFVTFYNITNINNILFLETVLTLLKIVPFLGLLVLYIVSIYKNTTFNIVSNNSINVQLFLRCLWGFVGLETGNIIGKNLNINQEERKLGTYIGMICVISFYVLSVFFAFKIVGTNILINNPAPYLVIFQKSLEGFFSNNAIQFALKTLIVIVLFGSINSWTVSSGYTGYDGGKLGVLPKIFQKKNNNNIPYMSIILSSIGVLIFVLLGINHNVYNITVKFIDISTCFFLLIYAMCILSYGKFYVKNFFWKLFYYILAFFLFIGFFMEIINNIKLLF